MLSLAVPLTISVVAPLMAATGRRQTCTHQLVKSRLLLCTCRCANARPRNRMNSTNFGVRSKSKNQSLNEVSV